MIDRNLAETSTVLDRLSEANIDLDDVAERLEREGLRRLQQVLMRSLQRLLRKPIRPDAQRALLSRLTEIPVRMRLSLLIAVLG